MAPRPLRVQLLGPLRAWRGQEQIDLGPQKQRAVFLSLALRANEPVRSDEILAAVWGEEHPANGTALLHTYLARLRRALEPDAPRRRRTNVIESTAGGYRLAVDAGDVDLLRCRRSVTEAEAMIGRGERELALDRLGEAMRSWPGDVRPELADLLRSQVAADALYVEWLEVGLRFVTLGLEEGRAGAVLRVAERLARAEPFHEVIHARYLLALAGTGQRAAAIAWYRQVRGQLRAELGIEPCPELAHAYRLIIEDGGGGERTGRVGPAVEFPHPWRGRRAPLGRLVGRDAEVSRLREFATGWRLLTLTGPAGVGKSALAMSLCEHLQDRFSDGVTVVDLSDARSGLHVCRELLAALDSRPGGSAEDPLEQVVARLRRRQMVLVLDDADWVLDACARTIDALVPSCERLLVIVTSREVVDLPYEAVWPVEPLPVPAPTARDEPEQVRGAAAGELFERRAVQACPSFRIDAGNVADVATICRALAGLPLPLELAAAQVRALPPAQVLGMVSEQPSRLVAHRRARPAHHSSFDHALWWGYAGLTTHERLLLAELGALGVRVSRDEVAERMAGSSRLSPTTAHSLLSRLVDKSWLRPDHSIGGREYAILEPIHRFLRRLAPIRVADPPRSPRWPPPAPTEPWPR